MQGSFKVITLCGSTRFRKRRRVPSSHRPQLVSSVSNIRMNRKGVTYDSLFGAYRKTARKITAVDERVQKSNTNASESNTNSAKGNTKNPLSKRQLLVLDY